MQSAFRNKTTLWLIVSALCFFVTSSVKSAEATPVKNVIVVMIDGAGATHSTLARWYNNGQPLVVEQLVTGAIRTFSGAFPGMPVVLMAQDSRGTPTYYGRPDLSRFLANTPLGAIPWRRYTLN